MPRAMVTRVVEQNIQLIEQNNDFIIKTFPLQPMPGVGGQAWWVMVVQTFNSNACVGAISVPTEFSAV